MIINPIIGGTGGMTAEIFVTGLSETDTVTCTKDGKVKQGKWVEREVTVYNENLVPAMTSNTEPKGVASASSVDTDGGTNVTRSAWKAFSRVFTGHNDQWSSSYGASLPQWIQYKFDSPKNISGMKLCNIADASYSTNSVGYVSISDDGENFTKIQEFSVPVTTVDSPSEVQLSKSYTTQYVRVYLTSYNDTYSSGTCRIALLQFMGYETSVQQGWLFDKLKSYGTYTITATNGTDTVTQDVLVDMATQYNIEMSYKLYLYNLGDECEEVTGGWGSKQLWEEYPNGVTSKGSDYLYGADEGNSYGNGQWATKNIINMSAYKKLCAIISAEWYCPSSSYPVHVGIRISKEDFNYQSDWGYSGGTAYTELAISQLTEQTSGSIEKKTFEIDITNIDKGLIWLYNWSGALYTYTMKAKYYAVWLE